MSQSAVNLIVVVLVAIAFLVIVGAALVQRPRSEWQTAAKAHRHHIRADQDLPKGRGRSKKVSLDRMWQLYSEEGSAYMGAPKLPDRQTVKTLIKPATPEQLEAAPYDVFPFLKPNWEAEDVEEDHFEEDHSVAPADEGVAGEAVSVELEEEPAPPPDPTEEDLSAWMEAVVTPEEESDGPPTDFSFTAPEADPEPEVDPDTDIDQPSSADLPAIPSTGSPEEPKIVE